MELEYRDPGVRRKLVIVLGLLLAMIAGGGAFLIINQAQRVAGQAALQRVDVVVAARDIPARKPIETVDIQLRAVPLDETNERGIFSQEDLVVGRVLAVPLMQGQLVTSNLLASTEAGGQFQLDDPSGSMRPDSRAMRAIAITVPDERAVGGMIKPNQAVDLIVTALINVPQNVLDGGRYYTDRSTKVVYQNMVILARQGVTYIIRAPLEIAEEITHLQAAGPALFTIVLRSDIDTEIVDATDLGATTNRIITKYGLPLPETYPAGSPLPAPTLAPTTAPATPRPTTRPGASPSP